MADSSVQLGKVGCVRPRFITQDNYLPLCAEIQCLQVYHLVTGSSLKSSIMCGYPSYDSSGGGVSDWLAPTGILKFCATNGACELNLGTPALRLISRSAPWRKSRKLSASTGHTRASKCRKMVQSLEVQFAGGGLDVA